MKTDTTRMPTVETVRQWIRDNPDFAAQVRQIGYLKTLDSIFEITRKACQAMQEGPLPSEDIGATLRRIEEKCVRLAELFIDALADQGEGPKEIQQWTDHLRRTALH